MTLMTILHPSPIFGPVKSRRLGISLGINVMPGDGKWCSFDCVYCECGLNRDRRTHTPLPTPEEICGALENTLSGMKSRGEKPDVLTFSGNGEPTMHPQFHTIVDMVLQLRDRYFPQAKVTVLSNSTQLHRPEVRQALMKVDNAVMKLDTVSPAYIRLVDRPTGHYDLDAIVGHLAGMNGHPIIQTMLMKGHITDADGNDVSVDNCLDSYILPYIETLRKIRPRRVMIYTLDREWPVPGLEKADRQTMDRIGQQLRQAGFDTQISY